MTIDKMVALLMAMKDRHGDVEVLFDCPYCGKSTRHDRLEAMAVVKSAHGEPTS